MVAKATHWPLLRHYTWRCIQLLSLLPKNPHSASSKASQNKNLPFLLHSVTLTHLNLLHQKHRCLLDFPILIQSRKTLSSSYTHLLFKSLIDGGGDISVPLVSLESLSSYGCNLKLQCSEGEQAHNLIVQVWLNGVVVCKYTLFSSPMFKLCLSVPPPWCTLAHRQWLPTVLAILRLLNVFCHNGCHGVSARLLRWTAQYCGRVDFDDSMCIHACISRCQRLIWPSALTIPLEPTIMYYGRGQIFEGCQAWQIVNVVQINTPWNSTPCG